MTIERARRELTRRLERSFLVEVANAKRDGRPISAASLTPALPRSWRSKRPSVKRATISLALAALINDGRIEAGSIAA